MEGEKRVSGLLVTSIGEGVMLSQGAFSRRVCRHREGFGVECVAGMRGKCSGAAGGSVQGVVLWQGTNMA